MRRIRYAVAGSLDGFIAGPNGEHDWIIMDPDIDFSAVYEEFDTILMGRKTFQASGGRAFGFGMKTVVVSRTLQQQDHPDVTIVGDNLKQALTFLRNQRGKDIWLFGGGVLFRSLLEMGLVDGVGVGVMPVLLGDGVPLLPGPFRQFKLKLREQKQYTSGIIGLEYDVLPTASPRRRGKPKRPANAGRQRSRRPKAAR
jgi:dihydrofolate reductase